MHTLGSDLVVRHLGCYTVCLYRFFLLYRTLFVVQDRKTQSQAVSWVVARIEFGHKVFRPWGFRLMEIPHDVSLLLPYVNGFLKIHFSLFIDKRYIIMRTILRIL